MKLLLENWRKYIAEGEATHFPWLQGIQGEDQLAAIKAIVNDESRFRGAGQGSFRRVYVPLENNDYVIKVIHEDDDAKKKMNKEDFETAVAYPLIFPKVYAHAPDWKWVVVENVEPLVEPQDMQQVLDKSFAAEQQAILENWKEMDASDWLSSLNIADPFHLMRVIMSSFRSDRDEAPTLDPRGKNELGFVDAALQADERDAMLAQSIIVPVAGAVYQELSKAMQSFAIDKYEIGRGNIGYDRGYNFKIIDSSIFDDDFAVGW